MQQRIAGIDGLRAIAVIFVIIEHRLIHPFLGRAAGVGEIGVAVFFVISGFLITSILIKEKSKETSFFEKIIRFYTHRFLRIFPIYYLTITVGVILGLHWFRDSNPVWFYTYTINIFIALQDAWIDRRVSHFWSLCVEEQFYLLWPFAVLLISNKFLLKLIIMVISIGLFVVIFQPLFNLDKVTIYVLPFQHCFALGVGALLAYCHEFHYELAKKIKVNQVAVYLILTAILFFMFLSFAPERITHLSQFMMFWAVDIATAILIHGMWAGQLPVFTTFME